MTNEFRVKTEQAARLIASAGEHAAAATAHGLDIFLTLLGRMPGYSAVNLLLIAEQYPRAYFLARGPYWQAQHGDGPVLRPEWAGKGIDLVLPASDGTCIGAYPMRLYDAQQTVNGPALHPKPEPMALDEIRQSATERLLQAGCMVSPTDEPELDCDELIPPDDNEAYEAAALVYQLADLFCSGGEDPGAKLTAALCTMSYLMGMGHPAPQLSMDGIEMLFDLSSDDPLAYLDRLQRQYHEFNCWLNISA